MKRFIYWLKKTIKRDKNCGGCCLSCRYYETCREDN